MTNPAGESNSGAFGFDSDRRLTLGSVVTSDAGLLAGREAGTLGFSARAARMRHSTRTDSMLASECCGNSIFRGLAGYEAVNDAERLHHDQAMRWWEGGSGRCGFAEPDGPLRDPAALGCGDLVCSNGHFGPMDRRISDTSWQ